LPIIVPNRRNSTAPSSSDPSSSFIRALPPGASRAYDEALSYLSSHTTDVLARLESLRKRPESPETEAAIARLEVEAYVNDPATRRVFRETNGRGHMDRPVMRHLAERKWWKEGGLDLLMQRVHLLNVVPDLISELSATYPLTLTASAEIEPGSIQSSSAFSTPPRLTLQLFEHPSPPISSSAPEGKYTLLVIDPDSPEHETQSFSQRVHYAKVDIPLSVLSGDDNLFDESRGQEVLSWEPPAPAQGSGKHRYVYLVLRQRTSTSTEITREAFDLRKYLSASSLSSRDIVGVTLVRSQWTKEDAEFVEQTYRAFRGIEAPVYGKPPKDMRYGYPMSSKAVRAEAIRREAWDAAVAELEGVAGEMEGFLAAEGEAAVKA
jgi:large subunit ribosomal protein L35